MLDINEWRLLKESVAAGGMNLGLGRQHTVGGPVGAHFLQEDEFEPEDADFEDDEDEDEDEDDYDGEQVDDDEGGFDDEDQSLPGDIIGSSSPDEGPDQTWPPDDSEGMDGLPTPDEEMLGGEDDFGGDMGGFGDDMGSEDDFGGDMGGEGDDMDFLGDLDPAMMGDEFGGEGDDAEDAYFGDDDMGDEFGGEEMGGEPCPDCNPDGMEEAGDPDCPTCAGEGYLDAEPDGDADDFAFAGAEDDGGAFADQEDDYMASYMRKYMSKGDKHDKHRDHCHCEGEDFLNSLCRQAANPAAKKNKSGLQEDALMNLMDPNSHFESEPQPGQPGFAPHGRVGAIGGGYTQDDVKDIPVLGESTRFPSLTQYAAWKARRRKK